MSEPTENPTPTPTLTVTIDKAQWDRRLQANELEAIIQFMSRATLQGSEAMAFIQCQHKLQALLRDEKPTA
jgi:hypothetical protein